MRPRTSTDSKIIVDSVFPKTSAQDNPSPSHYDNTEEMGKNLTGKYHTSKYRNSKAHFQSKSTRFSNLCTPFIIKKTMFLGLEDTNLRTTCLAKGNMSSLVTSAQERGPLWKEEDSPSLTYLSRDARVLLLTCSSGTWHISGSF
jgi:hypothetical protein